MVAVHATDTSVEVTSTDPLLSFPFFLYGPRFLFFSFPQGFGHDFLTEGFIFPHVMHVQLVCKCVCSICDTIVDVDSFLVKSFLFPIGGIVTKCVLG